MKTTRDLELPEPDQQSRQSDEEFQVVDAPLDQKQIKEIEDQQEIFKQLTIDQRLDSAGKRQFVFFPVGDRG